MVEIFDFAEKLPTLSVFVPLGTLPGGTAGMHTDSMIDDDLIHIPEIEQFLYFMVYIGENHFIFFSKATGFILIKPNSSS